MSRVIAQQLSQQLGQSVVVDNKPGAGGNISAEWVAKSAADGYTVFYNTSAIVIGPALYGKVNYDTLHDFAPVVLPYVRDGRLRALGVASLRRSALLPDVPTLAETVPGFEAAAWQGVVVPAQTPADIVARLNQEVNKALQTAEVRAKLAAQGADILGGPPAEYAAYLRSEMPRWAKAVKDSGAKAE